VRSRDRTLAVTVWICVNDRSINVARDANTRRLINVCDSINHSRLPPPPQARRVVRTPDAWWVASARRERRRETGWVIRTRTAAAAAVTRWHHNVPHNSQWCHNWQLLNAVDLIYAYKVGRKVNPIFFTLMLLIPPNMREKEWSLLMFWDTREQWYVMKLFSLL